MSLPPMKPRKPTKPGVTPHDHRRIRWRISACWRPECGYQHQPQNCKESSKASPTPASSAPSPAKSSPAKTSPTSAPSLYCKTSPSAPPWASPTSSATATTTSAAYPCSPPTSRTASCATTATSTRNTRTGSHRQNQGRHYVHHVDDRLSRHKLDFDLSPDLVDQWTFDSLGID